MRVVSSSAPIEAMHGSVFDYYTSRNAPFLHGGGAGGTEHLLSTIVFTGNKKVLEVGFGTGSTLVLLKQRFPDIDLYGLERSTLMMNKAKSRLAWVGHPVDQLHILSQGNSFPFEDHKFDVVYLESVLSILQLEEIRHLVNEIFRVLKSGGIFAINETIWLPNISMEEIQSINKICLEKFGIIQANQHLNTVEEWKFFFESNGFIVEKYEPTIQTQRRVAWNLAELMSYAFSIYGTCLSMFNPKHIRTRRLIRQVGTELQSYGKSYLKSYIIRMRKER
jgi:ubiquinone/menaquinone biosynthesis C-methylase UbiE